MSSTKRPRRFTGDVVALAAAKHYTSSAVAWSFSKRGAKVIGSIIAAAIVAMTLMVSMIMPTSMPTATADNPVPASIENEVRASSNGELTDEEIDQMAQELFTKQQQSQIPSVAAMAVGQTERSYGTVNLAAGEDVQIMAQEQLGGLNGLFHSCRTNLSASNSKDIKVDENDGWFTRNTTRVLNVASKPGRFIIGDVACGGALGAQGKLDNSKMQETNAKLLKEMAGGRVEDIDSPAKVYDDSMKSDTLMEATKYYTTFHRFDATSAAMSADLGFGSSSVYQAIMVPFKWLQQVFFLIAGMVAMVFGMFVTLVASVDIMGRLIYTSDEIYYSITNLIFTGGDGTNSLLGVALSILIMSAVISLGFGAFRAGSGMMNRAGSAAGMSMSPISLIGTAIFGTLALYVTMKQAGKNHPDASGVPTAAASPIGQANMTAADYFAKQGESISGISGVGESMTKEELDLLLAQANPGLADSTVGSLVSSSTSSTTDPWAWAPLSPGFFYAVVSKVGYALSDIISSVFVIIQRSIASSESSGTQCDMYVNAMHSLFMQTDAAQGNIRGASMVVSYDKLISEIHFKNYSIATFSQNAPTHSSGAAWCRSAEIQSSNSPQSQIVILRAAQLMGGPFGFGTQMAGADREMNLYIPGDFNMPDGSGGVTKVEPTDGDLVTADGQWVQRGNDDESEGERSNSGYRSYTAAKAFLGPEFFMNAGNGKQNAQRGGALAMTYFGACQWLPGRPQPYLNPAWSAVRRGSDGEFKEAKSMLGAFKMNDSLSGNEGGVCTYGFGNTGGGQAGDNKDQAYAYPPKSKDWSNAFPGRESGGGEEEDETSVVASDEGVSSATIEKSLEKNAYPEEGSIPIWGVGFGTNTTQSNTWNYYPAGKNIPIVTPILGFAIDADSGIDQFSDAPAAKAYMESIYYGVSNVGSGMVVSLIDTIAMVMVARYFGAILAGTVIAGIIGGLAIALLGLVGIFLILPIKTLRNTGKMIIKTIISSIITVSLVSSMFMLAFSLVRLMNALFYIDNLGGFANAILHAIGVIIALIATNKLIKMLFNVDTSSVNSAIQTMNSAAAPVLQATGMDKIRGPLDRSWWKGTNGQDKSFRKMLTGDEITNPSGAKQLLARATRRAPGASYGFAKDKVDGGGQKAYKKKIAKGASEERAQRAANRARRHRKEVLAPLAAPAMAIAGAKRASTVAAAGLGRAGERINDKTGFFGPRLANFARTGNFGRGDTFMDSRRRDSDIMDAANAEIAALRSRHEDFDSVLNETGGFVAYRDQESGQVGVFDVSKYTGTPEERNLLLGANAQMAGDEDGTALRAAAIQAGKAKEANGFADFLTKNGYEDGNREIVKSMGSSDKSEEAILKVKQDGQDVDEVLRDGARKADEEFEDSMNNRRPETVDDAPATDRDRDAYSRTDYGEGEEFRRDNASEATGGGSGQYGPERTVNDHPRDEVYDRERQDGGQAESRAEQPRPEPRDEYRDEPRPEPRDEQRGEAPRTEPRPEPRDEYRDEPRPEYDEAYDRGRQGGGQAEDRPEPRPESRPEPRDESYDRARGEREERRYDGPRPEAGTGSRTVNRGPSPRAGAGGGRTPTPRPARPADSVPDGARERASDRGGNNPIGRGVSNMRDTIGSIFGSRGRGGEE